MVYRERKSPRASRYDYSSPGAYFVTICTQDRFHYFWEVRNCAMKRNRIGDVAHEYRQKIPDIFPNVTVDEWVIMPNHMHGILILNDIPWSDGMTDINENRRDGSTGHPLETNILEETTTCFDGTRRDRVPTIDEKNDIKPIPKWPPWWSLWYIINQYKGSVTRQVRKNIDMGEYDLLCDIPFKRQKLYHDHIIRNQDAYTRIKYYIQNNPMKRSEDKFYT